MYSQLALKANLTLALTISHNPKPNLNSNEFLRVDLGTSWLPLRNDSVVLKTGIAV